MTKKQKNRTDQVKEEHDKTKFKMKRLIEKSEEKKGIANKTIEIKFGEKRRK